MTRTSWGATLATAMSLWACQDDPGSDRPPPGRFLGVGNIEGTNAAALDAELDASDDFLLAAVQRGEADYGTGLLGRPLGEPPVVILARHDPSFRPIWVRALDAVFNDATQVGVSQGPSGDVFAFVQGFAGELDLGDGVARAGHVLARLSQVDGAPAWTAQLDAAADAVDPYAARLVEALVDAEGRAVVLGAAHLAGASERVLVERLGGGDGATERRTLLAAMDGDAQPRDLALTLGDDLLVAGEFSGALTLDRVHDAGGAPSGFVVRLAAADLAPQWSLAVRLAESGTPLHLAATPDGDVLLAGALALPHDAEAPSPRTLRLLRLAGNTGALRWEARLVVDEASSLSIDDLVASADGDALVLGHYRGALSIGADRAPESAVDAMFLARYDGARGGAEWARYSRNSPTHPVRADLDDAGNAVAFGTFTKATSQTETASEIFFVFVAP